MRDIPLRYIERALDASAVEATAGDNRPATTLVVQQKLHQGFSGGP
jgi:hypothetical protein